MPLSDGTRLGPYDILTPLGAGGGEVYRATDTRLKRQVALKIPPRRSRQTLTGWPAFSAKPKSSPRSITHTSRPSTGSKTRPA